MTVVDVPLYSTVLSCSLLFWRGFLEPADGPAVDVESF